jgi:hypothetical protein
MSVAYGDEGLMTVSSLPMAKSLLVRPGKIGISHFTGSIANSTCGLSNFNGYFAMIILGGSKTCKPSTKVIGSVDPL